MDGLFFTMMTGHTEMLLDFFQDNPLVVGEIIIYTLFSYSFLSPSPRLSFCLSTHARRHTHTRTHESPEEERKEGKVELYVPSKSVK